MAQDPQGYPVQQYTNLDNDIVLEVLSDGTIVLINGTIMASGTGSPEGVVTAPPGSWYVRTDGVSPNFWYQKQIGTGNTGWALIGTGVANIVTSVFGRFGDVVAEFQDYAAVPNLQVGDGVSQGLLFVTASGEVSLTDGTGGDSLAMDGLGTTQLNGNVVVATGIATVRLNVGAIQIQLDASGGGSLILNDVSGAQVILSPTTAQIVDADGNGFSTTIAGDTAKMESSGGSAITLANGNFNFLTLQIFANNAAAITGGLIAGDLYRNGANPDVVCVVH